MSIVTCTILFCHPHSLWQVGTQNSLQYSNVTYMCVYLEGKVQYYPRTGHEGLEG